MALSNSQYDSIMRRYNQKQFRNKRELDKRVAEVYEKIPAIQDINREISTAAVASAKKLLEGDQNALGQLRETIADLREQKQILLRSGGFPDGYLEMGYECPDCKDTGYVNHKKCHCFKMAEIEFLYAQSNIKEKLEKENFSTFSYEFFDDENLDERSGRTAREYMRQVVSQCHGFVERFPAEKGSILFTGNTGLGKTFLSNCIAKELIDQSFSVVYLSATDMFDILSKNKFEYDAPEEARDMYQYILDCDLLIIDDLGTELINTFTTSQLFYCVNERLNREKGTVISTNLPVNRMRDEFTDRVMSRIMSKYTIIPLFGDDIRIQKKLKKID